MSVDTNKLNEFLGHFINDLGASVHAGMVVIGDRLGLYKALAQESMTAPELAKQTNTDERYVREWAASQAAGGYLTYEPTTERFGMTEEQILTLAREDGPAFLPGAFELALGSLAAVPRITEAFRSGAGMGWFEHEESVFHGCEKFFRPGYAANLINSWIPSLDGVNEKLARGAKVADVGCGKGASTILMAKAFPQSEFHGFDYHDKSIELARAAAEREGVTDRVTFDVAPAKEFPGSGYDFVSVFDCLHDMGDPVGAAAHVKKTLAPGGTWMIVEPFANDDTAANHNPIGRIYYSASATVCVPCSLAQEVGMGLGAQAGPARMEKVVRDGGFGHFRKATETPFNLVFEAR